MTQTLTEVNLFRLVRAVSRRMWLKDTLRVGPRAIGLALLGIFVGQVLGPRLGTAAAVVVVLGVGAGLALVISRARRMPGSMAAAIQLDRGLDLKERVSTAIHLVETGAEGAVAAEQIADAGRHAWSVEVGSAYRVAMPWKDLGAVALLGIAVALLAVTPIGVGLREALESSVGTRSEISGTIDADTRSGTAGGHSDAALAESELDELKRALEQLEISSNPEALAQRAALEALGQELRTSSVSRGFGRELEDGNLAAAAAELGRLAEAMPEMNAGEIEKLQRDLERAAEITADDPILGAEFSRAAQSLGAGQRRAAGDDLARAAESVGQLAPVLAAEEDLQERIAALEREIGEREGAGGLPGTEGSEGTDPGSPAGTGELGGNLPGAGLESNAQGSERGEIEMLGLDERLDAAGELEIVRIDATEDAPPEDFAPPATQLNGDPESSLEPSAGDYGYVQPLPAIGDELSIDAGGVVADYFSDGERP